VANDNEILYPKNERQGLDGGLNNRFEKHLIADNESPSCLNVIFDNGAVETRLGTRKANSTAVGTFAGHGLYTRHDSDNIAQTMIAWFNGTAYAYGTNTFVTIGSAQSIFTAGVRVCASEYENYIYFNNGYNVAYKYNGAFTRHGIYPPSANTASIVCADSGNVTGDIQYKFTYVNSNLVEGDVTSATATYTAAGGTVSITSIPTAYASFGVLYRRIYRRASAGTYLRVTELQDNTTTSYSDNLADGSLGAEAPTDQGVPPKYSAIITHQNRLFCNDLENPSLVWYSELGNPYVFKTTSFEEVGDNSGDLVQGFVIHDNGLVILCDKSNYLLYMPDTTPANWEMIKLRSPYGTRSPYSGFSYNNKQMYAAVENDNFVGFAAISGDSADPDATLLTVSAAGSDLKSNRIEPDMLEVPSNMVPRISSIVYKNKAYIALAYGSGQTTNNRIYVFDFSINNLSKKQEASWVPWTGLNPEQFTVLNGTLYYQTSTATGFVYEMERPSTYSDDGSAINSYFWTKEFSGRPGHEQFMKDVRYVNILYEKPGSYFMDLNYKVDSDEGDGNQVQVDLNPGSSLWGTMTWGIDDWGGGREYDEDRQYLGQLIGKRIQFRFSNQNTAGQKFKVLGIQFGYLLKGRR
jgi:hypothetical protein